MNGDSFSAMNTTIVTQGLPERWRKQARQWFAFAEAQLSRFLPDSELSRLNRAAGGTFLATPLLYQVLAEADRYYGETGGLFSPYLGKVIARLGYDKSFERLRERDGEAGGSSGTADRSEAARAEGTRGGAAADSASGGVGAAGAASGGGGAGGMAAGSGGGAGDAAAGRCGGAAGAAAGRDGGAAGKGGGAAPDAGDGGGDGSRMEAGSGDCSEAPAKGDGGGAATVRGNPVAELDPRSRAIRLRPEAAVDLGGIAKGWTARHLAKLARQDGVRTGAVGAGGDLVLWGCPPDGWRIGIADPWAEDADRLVLTLRRGAGIATSSAIKRRWLGDDGSARHHIVDPRTVQPALSDLAQATVIAPDAVMAEVYAKCALLLGADAGAAWLARSHPRCALIGIKHDGSLLCSGDLEPYLMEERDRHERIG